MKNRLLALVNVALIPYVAIRYPRELARYLGAIATTLKTGRPA